MRRHFAFAFALVCSINAHALESLRVGSELLVVGDSAAKVKALMGEPVVRGQGGAGKRSHKSSSKSAGKSKKQDAKEKGEKWQYRRENHTTIFTIAGGKVVQIEDLPR
jgi:hypothetical protein